MRSQASSAVSMPPTDTSVTSFRPVREPAKHLGRACLERGTGDTAGVGQYGGIRHQAGARGRRVDRHDAADVLCDREVRHIVERIVAQVGTELEEHRAIESQADELGADALEERP